MALRVVSVPIKSIIENDRFEPRFFYNQMKLKKVFDKYGYQKLNNLATTQSGSTPEHNVERKSQDDHYFIKSADVKRYNLNFSTMSFVSKEIHASRINFKVVPNDILLSNTGKYLGFSCAVPKALEEATTNQNVIRIRLKKDVEKPFTPYYILALLNSLFGQIQIESLLTLTGQKYLSIEKFKNFKIPILEKKAVEKISLKTSTAIECEQNSLEIVTQAQNLFYKKLGIDFSKIKKEKAFSVQLSDFADENLWTPAFSYPLYVNTLKAIQAKWQTVSLGEIVTTKKGNEVGSENYNKYLDKKNSDIPFVRTTDIVNYEADQFPDFYIPEEIYEDLSQDIKAGDVLFTKDGKIGMLAMISKNDKTIIASGIARLRLNTVARKYHLTPEYLFIVLSLKETGLYPAKRRTVVASTIPHLREDRLKEFEIPILDKKSIDEITQLVKKAFELKNQKKKLIKEIRKEIDDKLDI